MKRRTRVYAVVCLAMLLVLSLASPALAYIDPGSASYFFQILVGAFFGGLMVVKMYWRRIISFFTSRRSGKPAPAAEDKQ